MSSNPPTIKTREESNVLHDKETWTEIADVLAEIQNGADAKFEELTGIERAFITQETDRVLTIVALKIFPKYLEQMKGEIRKADLKALTSWVEGKLKPEKGHWETPPEKMEQLALTNGYNQAIYDFVAHLTSLEGEI